MWEINFLTKEGVAGAGANEFIHEETEFAADSGVYFPQSARAAIVRK